MQTHKDPMRQQAKTSEAELKRKNRGHEATKEMEAEDEDEENDKVGDKKRLRVSRACDQCRRRKDKCDGRQPICQPCSNIKRVCTYNMFTKKRGLPTGYVRSIEILLGLVFRHVEGSEALVSMLLATDINVTDPKALSLLTAGNTPRTESLAEYWRKSTIAKQIEILLPAAESLEDEDTFSQRLNEKLNLAWSMVAVQNTTPSRPPKTLNGNSVPADNALNPLPILSTTETLLDASLPPPHERNALKLPSNWLQLLDLYFSNTHSWFPICQKQDLLRPAYMLASTKYEGTDTLASGERAFLWAVIAYALHQCSRFDIEHCNQSSYIQCSSEEVISAAKGLVTLDSQTFEHGHVRALLVLGLLEMGRECWTTAWVLIGQALYIAVDLGVIVPASQGPADSHNVYEGQNRLSRGCFVLDTLISACVGRRPYLKRSDLQSTAVLQVDGIEEWEAWQPSDLWKVDVQDIKSRHPSPGRILSTSNQFVELIALLNDLISTTEVPLQNMVSMFSQGLGAWRQQLPPHCQVFTSVEAQYNAQKSPQLLNLCLTYIFVSNLLRAKAGGVIPTTQQDPALAWDGSMDQWFRAITEHTENHGRLWMPLKFFQSLQGSPKSIQQNTNDIISNQLTSFTMSNHHNQLATMSSEATTSTNPNLFCQPQAELLDTTSFDIGADGNPRLNPIRTTQLTIQTQKSDEHQMFGAEGILISSRLAEGIDLSNFSRSLNGVNDDDFLFNSLASLDSVDWTANQPEFMEHLGFTGDYVQSDYQSFFNT